MPGPPHFKIRPLDNVGVEVLDFDFNQPLTDAMRAELKSLWYEHAILVFRGQELTPEIKSLSAALLAR